MCYLSHRIAEWKWKDDIFLVISRDPSIHTLMTFPIISYFFQINQFTTLDNSFSIVLFVFSNKLYSFKYSSSDILLVLSISIDLSSDNENFLNLIIIQTCVVSMSSDSFSTYVLRVYFKKCTFLFSVVYYFESMLKFHIAW